MVKTVLVLCIGVAVGYGFGFKDAKSHDKPVVTRVVDRIGGSHRGKYDPNIDKHAETIVR